MNLIALVKSNNTFIYIYLNISVTSISYITRKTDTIDEMPHFIISPSKLFELDNFIDSPDRLLKHLSCSFVLQGFNKRNQIFIRPPKLTYTEPGVITSEDYRIYPSREGYAVNYAPGKKREFSELYDALDWVLNQHQPAKAESKIVKNILAVY